MLYHVFALARGFFYHPGDCDLETEKEILKNYCIPFLQGKPFSIGGAKLDDRQIASLSIFRSKLSSAKLVKEANAIISPEKRRGDEYEAMRIVESVVDITSDIMRKASDSIGGSIINSEPTHSAINNFAGSTFYNSQVTGFIEDSVMNIIVNKPEIKDWLRKISAELEKNNVQNDELIDIIDTLSAALQAPKPSGAIIKPAVEAIKAIGFNLVSSSIWQYLLTNPPI
jgi:hypothetical protein